jgi:hypothetical protein
MNPTSRENAEALHCGVAKVCTLPAELVAPGGVGTHSGCQ